MEYTYTIIIPHYNIPHLLERCLSSIPCRADLQVIVVDDCSDRDSVAKLKTIESQFSHVTFVYLQVNGGGGKARNEGLKRAQGCYVLFADADDFFNYCINQILEEYKETVYDVVFFDANSVDTDLYCQASRSIHLNKWMHKYDKKPKQAIADLRYGFGESWSKLVRRELIEYHGICFSETNIHNDTKFSYLIGYYAKRIHVDKRALYCITDRKGSVSKCLSVDRLFTRTQIFAEAAVFLHNQGIHRFESFLYSPWLRFCIRGEWKKARRCRQIMLENGMSDGMVIKGLILYILKYVVRLPVKIFHFAVPSIL